ncbi:hypothetical protein AVEN_229053-1 [Araneus ventricosus]|uniref:Uncharacterized protein n=1 Tax=Araneus ventricosus TaxID=182803 RepID=A0A4Y2CX50_ARAVE|nr:hypothetical protein AVEN_229053-1 [Araneus ventricosus]
MGLHEVNIHKMITSYEVAYIFNQAYMNLAATEKELSGFKDTRIYPANPDKFKYNRFSPTQKLKHLGLSPKTDNMHLPQADISESSITKMVYQEFPELPKQPMSVLM